LALADSRGDVRACIALEADDSLYLELRDSEGRALFSAP
jgi:hypothetical protein